MRKILCHCVNKIQILTRNYRGSMLIRPFCALLNDKEFCFSLIGIDANHYDFSVIVTNFGPKLRCYGQQSAFYGFPMIIAGPEPFLI